MNFIKFLKFGLVGFSGLIIDFAITWLCKEKLSLNKYVANGMGFLFGVTNNYFLNKYFTFENHNPDIGTQFTSFLIISMIGFGLNTGFLYLLQKNTSLNFYVCKILVTLLVFVWNFTANNLYTFNN
ncbi:GtrA family protein [Flavobacterium crassostreae]|uniref:Glycosyl transferase family 2 n=1 Tax=Flavobacterium crassostreae TaxID=1763534 RepID=A0A1B9E4K1_9FLAO|nr:GtrA family protein [Flavobacterium crassostreae]OCB76859.1 glycosyl transferase family 2 [Flavobacterium crassostreae]